MKFEIGATLKAQDKNSWLPNLIVVEVLNNVICVQTSGYAGLKWFSKKEILGKYQEKI